MGGIADIAQSASVRQSEVRTRPNSSGRLAMFAAMRRASSRVSSLAAASDAKSAHVLLDHLVGELLELRWYIEAECRGGLEVDQEIELLRPLYRQVTCLGTMQDLPDVFPASSE